MGIAGFYIWLKATYPTCFLRCQQKAIYDYIHVDVNHILHSCLTGVSTDEQFRRRLFQTLDTLFCNFTATRQVTLAVDGTSPYSKILLQRSRRLLSLKNINVNKVSPLHLTPGTKFMAQVDKWLKQYSDRMQRMYQFLKVKFIVIPTTEAGEGEIKVFKILLDEGAKYPERTHLVVGNDADLTVIASAAKPIENIWMLIKTQNQMELFSIPKMLSKLSAKLHSINKTNIFITTNQWRTDFVILSVMLGNDYLPKLNYIKFETLWEAYFKTVENKDTSISSIKYGIIDINNESPKFNQRFLEDLTYNIVNLLPNKSYRALDLHTYNELKIKNYLEGLLWCLKMYDSAECPMYDYLYNYQTSVSPAELKFYVESVKIHNLDVPVSDTAPISCDMFPLLVIPKKARSLVMPKYQHLIDNQLKHMYETEECVPCAEHKAQLSTLHKELIKIRVQLKGSDLLVGEENKIKKQLSKTCISLKEHKTNHQHRFTSDDIATIISLTSKIR